jgi:peptidoglycan/xylan/chitin deacetylase (PgdA/CDA1 family)
MKKVLVLLACLVYLFVFPTGSQGAQNMNSKLLTYKLPHFQKEFLPYYYFENIKSYRSKKILKGHFQNMSTPLTYPQNELTIPILMYHHFDKEIVANTVVHPDQFQEQLSTLKQNGYTPINDFELMEFMEGRRILPEKPILITIDDGYESNYTLAFPVIKKENFKATIYVVSSQMRKSKNDVSQGIRKLTWSQLREMYLSGLVEVQSHTHNMHYKDEISEGVALPALARPIRSTGQNRDEHTDRLVEDLDMSKQMIENNIGNNVISIAYPYGYYNEISEESIKTIGFKLSYLVKPGVNHKKSGCYLLKRINVGPDMGGNDIIDQIESYRTFY